ncbi:MAG: sugar phosphate isomerase/epimerase family protein [Candidatus Latescibacteria bacterium]|nr:sugar phosphate isomerase/epimerase family protein [Candidatus Latescibacterota bacterium]
MARFTLCFNTSTIRPAALMDKIRAAGEAGYQAIELWNDDLTAFEVSGRSLSEVRRALGDYGMRVPDVVHLPGWMDAEESSYRTDVLGEARRRMEQGAAVGASRIIVGPAHGRVDLNLAAERYCELMALGHEIGCLPSLEFLGFVDQVNNVDTLMEIVGKAGHPSTTVVMDAFHIYRGGGQEEDVLKVPGDQISIFHIDDVPRTSKPRRLLTDADRVYPGDGILDLKGMLDLLREQGYSGPVSLELFNGRLWKEDPFEVARRGAEKVRPLIE